MSKDPVNDYVDARAAFIEIDDKLEAIATLADTLHRNLAFHRDNFLFTNTEDKSALKGAAFDESVNYINAKNWPTPKEINGLISEWHLARNHLRILWEALSEEKQESLKSPPKTARI